MFDHFLWSVVVVPLLLVVVVRLLVDRLPPGAAAVALAWSAAVAAAASLANLAVFTVKATAEVPAVGRLFGWSPGVVADDTAHVAWAPWLSAALLCAAAVSVTRRRRRHRRALAAADVGPSDGGLVLLPDQSAQAFAVPGRPGHVVVTAGMRRLLTDRQFDALLAHEHAHLAGGHHRLIRLAELAAAAHPCLWWVARHVDYLVERAADEHAATVVGSRGTVAHAIGIAALAASERPRAGGRRAADGRPADGRRDAPYGLHAASRGGVVPRRVAHLLRPAAGVGRPVLCLLPVLPALFSVAWTGEAIYDLVELLSLARHGR